MIMFDLKTVQTFSFFGKGIVDLFSEYDTILTRKVLEWFL